MRNGRFAILLALGGTALLSAGCQAPPQPTGPTLASVKADTPEDYELLFTAVEDTLEAYYLPPDRRDRQQGVITTHRDTTGNAFEFWRPQPTCPYYWAEANLQTIQRQATVHIRPADEAGLYELDVQVDRYRYRLEERQIDNAAAALRTFSSDAPTFAERSGSTVTAGSRSRAYAKLKDTSYWVHLGRDELMEQAVVAAILRRYGSGTVAEDFGPQRNSPE